MRARGPLQTLASSPTMVGAITTLIVIVAVFLAYNANQGLPFVPVYRVSVEIPNAARLVDQNEVRIGGDRVGVVESIEPIRATESTAEREAAEAEAEATGEPAGDVSARLNLKLDQDVEPLPQDSLFRVRYRSAFGLKYLEIARGDGASAPEGFTFPSSQTIAQTEFDDINNTFDRRTRANGRTNLEGFGNAFAARGTSLNEAIEALEPLLTDLKPVSRALLARSSRPALRRLFPELADAARIVAPVAEQQAELFTNAAIAFAAISEDEQALKDTISEGPPTLEAGIETLPRQRPFLRDFTTLSRILRPGARELRVALPTLNDAIEVGTPVLRRTPPVNRDLRRVFAELEDLVEQPETKRTFERLRDTFGEARPLVEHVTPYQTVCNYWNYDWYNLFEHLSQRDEVGFLERVYPVNLPSSEEQEGSPAGYTGIQANGRSAQSGEFDPENLAILHGPPYSPAVDADGNADCKQGQTGYPLGENLIPGQPPSIPAMGNFNYPGDPRGPTFTGRTSEP